MAFFKLTNAQKNIYTQQQLYPSSPMFNIGGIVLIRGRINENILEESIIHCISNNDAFNIRLKNVDGETVQFFSQDKITEVEHIDFSETDNPEQELNNWTDTKLKKMFSIYNSKLYNTATFKLTDDYFGYFMNFHHIIADGLSMKIIVSNITKRYEAIAGDSFDDDSGTTYCYKNHIEKERQYLESESFAIDKEYWINNLSKTKSRYTDEKTTYGKRKTFNFRCSKEIKEFCLKNNISLNSFFILVYSLFEWKRYATKDITVGVPVLGRTGKRERQTIGMFVNNLVFALKIDENKIFLDALKDIVKKLKNDFRHQAYPYNYLAKDLELEGKILFNTSINYYGTSFPESIAGLPFLVKEYFNENQQYNMQIIIREWYDSNEIQLDVDYKIQKYNSDFIDDMINRMEIISNYIIMNSTNKLSDLDYCTENEYDELVYKYNLTNADIAGNVKTVLDLIQKSAYLYPENIAIMQDDRNISYKDLIKKTRDIAYQLQLSSIKPNDVVGIYIENSIESILAILAIMMVGASYLPISTTTPKKRVDYILKAANVKYVLVNRNKKLEDFDFIKQIQIEAINIVGDYEFYNQVLEEQKAYTIYTSGTSGKPKGVQISHRSLLNYSIWAGREYEINKDDVFAFFTSIAFDLTVTSIFTPLINGASIKIYEENTLISDILSENICTVIKATPAHLRLLKNINFDKNKLSRIIVGGANLSTNLTQAVYKAFGNNLKIFNEYGPTEATVGCMCYEYDPKVNYGDYIPIGRPIQNMNILVLDDCLKPVPIGYCGEIYISGLGLANKYFNETDERNSVFLECPYISQGLLYKTGDFAKFESEDSILYIGRNDNQVNINGYRIEISEVESKFLELEGIEDIAVVEEKVDCSSILVGYYVSNRELHEADIRKNMLEQLPLYMIPHILINIPKMLLTNNGKIDTNGLKEKYFIDTSADNNYSGNLTENETLLFTAIKDVLDIDASTGSNFYKIGGDSIKAIQVSSYLNEKGFDLSANKILLYPDLREAANYIKTNNNSQMVKHSEYKNIIKTPILKWYIEHYYRFEPNYCQFIRLDMHKNISKEQWEELVAILVDTHSILQVRLASDLEFYIEKQPYNFFHEYFLDSFDDSQRFLQISEELKANLDIENGKILQCALCHTNDKNTVIMCLHHAAVDGVSWRIILNDIEKLISNLNDKAVLLNEVTTFVQWSHNLNLNKDRFTDEKDYWTNMLYLDKPMKIWGDNTDTFKKKKLVFSILVNDIKNIFSKTYITVEELLISSLCLAINNLFDLDEILIRLENNGRLIDTNDLDLSNTVGWLTTFFPLKIKSDKHSIEKTIKSTKESIRRILNQGIGFGLVTEPKQMQNDWINFNYLGDIEQNYKYFNADILSNFEVSDKTPLLEIFSVISYVKQGSLFVVFEFPDDIEAEEKIIKIFDDYKKYLQQISSFLSINDEPIYTPTDFIADELSQEDIDNLLACL